MITTLENLGVHVLVTLEVGEHTVGVVVPESVELKLGDTGWVRPTPGRSLVYRADDGELITASTVPDAEKAAKAVG